MSSLNSRAASCVALVLTSLALGAAASDAFGSRVRTTTHPAHTRALARAVSGHDTAFDTSARAATRTGEQIYHSTCVACHGNKGNGASRTTVGFERPIPDFSDCNFATRETRSDWRAIIRDGGPVRGFSRIMPAFRYLLTSEEIERVITYLHQFCTDPAWPRGEFNLPLAQRTEKAFPEDEIVVTTEINTKSPGLVGNHLILEKRFGARNMVEVDVPFSFVQRPDSESWVGGIGDIAIVPKHVFFSSLASGSILSGSAGVILPTGNTDSGIGSGTTAFEINALFGQLLPSRSFLQLQGSFEVPTRLALAPRSVFWSGVLGKTIPFGEISRIWTPMVELTGTRDLVHGAPIDWSVVPQFQISLSALQHVRANVGVDVPLTQRDVRRTQILAYVLWDTFDGPLFQFWHGWCPGCER